MPFYLRGSFDDKLAQKSFKLLKRLKVFGFNEAEVNCLLCSDTAFGLGELILCTEKGVMYLPRLANALSKYDYSAISSVTIEVVYNYPSVCLTISGGDSVRLYVASKYADDMADYIKSKISAVTPPGGISAADEIAKFKGLLDSGAITEEEFSAKKKQLLGI